MTETTTSTKVVDSDPVKVTSPRHQEGYDGNRELPPVATRSGDWDPVAIRVPKLKCHIQALQSGRRDWNIRAKLYCSGTSCNP